MNPDRATAAVDSLFASVLAAGENGARARAVLASCADETAARRGAVPGRAGSVPRGRGGRCALVRKAAGAGARGAQPARAARAVAAAGCGALLARSRRGRGDATHRGRRSLAGGITAEGRPRRHAPRRARDPRAARDASAAAAAAGRNRAAGDRGRAPERAPARGGPDGRAAEGRRAPGARRGRGRLAAVAGRAMPCSSRWCCSRRPRWRSPCRGSSGSCRGTCAASPSTKRCVRSCAPPRASSWSAKPAAAESAPILDGSMRCT